MKTFKHNAVKVKNPNTGNFEELPSFGGGSSVSIDKTLSEEGKAADAKEVGDRLSQLSDEKANQTDVDELKGDLEQLKQGGGTGSCTGLSAEAIDKLEEVGNHLAYTTSDGGSKWTELISILRNGSSSGGSGETEKTLSSISATYTGGDVAVGTALTDLTGITVTATYSDGSTENVTGYSLSGEILEGSNTITISYNGKTTTFTVAGIVESGGDTTAELITNGLVGFWDFRNCDYSASTMPATVGNGKIVRFGGTSSDDYGIIANTAFAYNPDGDSGYTSFNKPFSLVGMGYSTDKGDVPTLWNYLIVASNLNSIFGSVGKVKWYDISGNKNDLSTVSGNTDIPINTLESGFSYFIISVDENNILKYYYQGEHVLTLDPVELV